MVMENEIPWGWFVEERLRIEVRILEDVKLKYTGAK